MMSTSLSDFLVIIPTYRRRDPLRAAIKSALGQTGITKQIIVADDCSDGSAAEVVKDFPDVTYLKTPTPSGGWPGRVRNFAFNSSCEMGIKANYVHFLDDDDTVPEGHYAVVKETFHKHPSIGVVFGVLRPFCTFSDDPDRRKRQEQQLQDVRNWRVQITRFPWLYQQIGATLKLPSVTQWLYRQRALFGPEMFLCSGGIIRYRHVVELGGFPDIRITQDFSFYTEAIRKFGALFLKREAAGYGVGDPFAIWNPLNLDEAAKPAHTSEWRQEVRLRKRMIRDEMGYFKYYSSNIIFRVVDIVLNRGVIPALDRRGYFTDLYRLLEPDRFAKNPAPEEPT
jgi:glycosyltransferase involved in cell wall biosynthesis